MRIVILALLAIVAATAPLLPKTDAEAAKLNPWPAQFEGKSLSPMPEADADNYFQNGFPGHVARFSDGRRQIVLRQVSEATRRLHPARDCFQALGYEIDNASMERQSKAQTRSCFDATKNGVTLRICEEITDAEGTSYPEVSAWYWPALTGRSKGPWLAATIVETKSSNLNR